MTRPDDATAEQARAAAPDRSVWVSANAGSGKTKVLTDRVARLLLAGTQPEHILCLTYTKAAAAEMQNRLFERLGGWAMLEDAKLTERLCELGEPPGSLDSDRLRAARTLFARALETPGGLKIQTIHSFCAALLRRFPLEAGVSPGFTEIEERAGRRLRAEIVEQLAESQEEVFDGLAAHLSGGEFDKFLGEIARHADRFRTEPDAAAIWRAFGLEPDFDAGALLSGVFLGGEAALIARAVPVLIAGGGNDEKAARKLQGIDLAAPTPQTVAELENVFLHGSDTKTAPDAARIGALPKKATQPAFAHLQPAFDEFMSRVEWARPLRRALEAAERALALHRFAGLFVVEYEARKQAHGWLDFDDLIGRARALLSTSDVAQWVLFRLDGGLDHILVDEAQDTSPEQWEVIWKLAEEFTAGTGARPEVERTIFVVGDEKQSIYSFQGADPAAFARMKEHFAAHLDGIGKALETSDLHFSFRSAEAVLRAVDCTFSGEAAQGVARQVTHRAFKTDLPGRVDVWPFVPKSDSAEPPAWYQPVDMPAQDDPAITLAGRIADEIRDMLDRGERITRQDREGIHTRPVTPGDILILVQRRSELFHEIIRGLKAAGLPVAGADRLRIGGELAVKDLTALLNFLATPEDDLSLAAALRSPLLGFSERELFSLAHERPGYLWRALQDRGAAFPETLDMLTDLRDAADFLRPFELLERILTRHGGRARLLARLGMEAEDGIDALLAQALGYERAEVPSLIGFLGWLASDEVEIKRQMDSAGDQVRVMTVHGAKGLEAPVVILPDTAKRPFRISQQLYPLGDGVAPGWLQSVGDAPPILTEAREALKDRQMDERMRLLYVAMTRAESWLILCGAGDPGKEGESWYSIARRGIRTAGAVEAEMPGGTGLRLAAGDWPEPGQATGAARPAQTALPDWAGRRAPVPPRPAEPLSPSDLGGAKALPGETEGLDEDAAKRRGRQIHLLLEMLPDRPRADWPAVAEACLAHGPDAAAPETRAALLAEVTALLDAPALAPIFRPGSLAEVGIAAPDAAPGGAPMLGYIDRLIVEPGRVLAVDFKTNAVVPNRPEDTPEGILRQMAAYRAALVRIYPGREVEVAILWTAAASLMHLPHDIVRVPPIAPPAS
ncbi:double-strand break repair helicase AddA [Maritimibacter sp. 55A14]|uniref:double-strand break repair helicase AddA n=1 Tax=Maritimibacter sp. 55A14 TaxID=2174844 RepID=UPI000D6152DC|nr:double-strand break repair helicase AddA [Maritimibacter sp. 55A14]PWE33465.1 double-strand break repair helicase AddA [Maritimibacter sp. 55A14]